MKPDWLREAEAADDRLRAEREYEELVAHRCDHDVVHKSAEADDIMHRVAERSEPAPPFSDAQLDVLAEVVAKLLDQIEDLRRWSASTRSPRCTARSTPSSPSCPTPPRQPTPTRAAT